MCQTFEVRLQSKHDPHSGSWQETFEYRLPKVILFLHKSLIFPQVEYTGQLCFHYHKDKKLLERVERCSRKMPELKAQRYKQQLDNLNSAHWSRDDGGVIRYNSSILQMR